MRYLERGMNAMGACAQLMGLDGTLRWAFVPDPSGRHVFCKGWKPPRLKGPGGRQTCGAHHRRGIRADDQQLVDRAAAHAGSPATPPWAAR